MYGDIYSVINGQVALVLWLGVWYNWEGSSLLGDFHLRKEVVRYVYL